MNRINIYFCPPPLGYKWIPGDRYIFSLLKKLFNKKKVSGLEKVCINLCKGLDILKIDYTVNRPFKRIKPTEPVVVLGVGKYALQGYAQPNPVIAGIGLMTHPSEWPNLFEQYPVAKYLQHSAWTNNIYARYFGPEKCDQWPSGIDTDHWVADDKKSKTTDFLIYNKIMWDKPDTDINLRLPILQKLEQLGLSYKEITYGQYKEPEYIELLNQCKAMIFLCEHESQGFACCEAMSMNVPVLAWDQGFWLDPNRFKWNDPVVPATSIPFFDARCGMSFKNISVYNDTLPAFWDKVKAGSFNPREYILENLTLKKSAERMLTIINNVYQ
jgi:glycosyltransferase involved in cell wall biosynthesis